MKDLKGKDVYLLAICGMGMGSLAGYLKESGINVWGSDKNIFPPMSDQLRGLGIEIKDGFSTDHLKENVDLLIVGNAVIKGSDEANSIQRIKIPCFSMPGFLEKHVLIDRHPLVVAGTHGKTTTASLLGWVLEASGVDPSVLVGGVVKDWGKSYRVGRGKFFVLEGDEYDSAFFDKVPKFLHYRPKDLILTGIEFDHCDIYSSLREIKDQFKRLISLIPKEGNIVAYGEDRDLVEVCRSARCKIQTYGFSKDCDYDVKNLSFLEGGAGFDVYRKGNFIMHIDSPLMGRQNILNALGVAALSDSLSIPHDSIEKGIKTFPGVKRRQEIIADVDGILVVDDYAHHPTAIEMTINGFKLSYPQRRIWAVFEPRTNTSRRKFFQESLPRSFTGADIIIIAKIYNEDLLRKDEVLDVGHVVEEVQRLGKEAHYIPGIDEIVDKISSEAKEGDIILLMSNGAFGGIYEKLIKILRKRRQG